MLLCSPRFSRCRQGRMFLRQSLRAGEGVHDQESLQQKGENRGKAVILYRRKQSYVPFDHYPLISNTEVREKKTTCHGTAEAAAAKSRVACAVISGCSVGGVGHWGALSAHTLLRLHLLANQLPPAKRCILSEGSTSWPWLRVRVEMIRQRARSTWGSLSRDANGELAQEKVKKALLLERPCI